MADTDQVATELAAMRERNENGDLRDFAFNDAPRLLAAVEAVLDRHKPEGRSWEVVRCARHRLGSSVVTTEMRTCPDCQFTERVTCWQSKCADEGWPCKDYEAISRAVARGRGEP
jgi:hypothetical protein